MTATEFGFHTVPTIEHAFVSTVDTRSGNFLRYTVLSEVAIRKNL